MTRAYKTDRDNYSTKTLMICPKCGNEIIGKVNQNRIKCSQCGIICLPKLPRCKKCNTAFLNSEDLAIHNYCNHRKEVIVNG